jgi:DnaJ-class molecular chaperone
MPQQLKRLLVVFAILIAGLLAARRFLVPETFGALGHYRAAAIDTVAGLPIRYVGAAACNECHDDVVAEKARSRHAAVACEVCHGAAAKHAQDPDSEMPPAPRERDRCPLCHGYNPSRPTGFPQIDPQTHNPADPCITCHEPHQPVTPHTPQECSACHGQVARTKALSAHAPLACTRCHEVPEEHKINPRLVGATKPRDRQMCGQCHAKDTARPPDIAKAVPRIGMNSHGGGQVCWQCHYPHHPEAK